MRAALALALLTAVLAGCTALPARKATPDATAPYPAIAPLDALLAEGDRVRATGGDAAAVSARAARLRARAAALREAGG
jgi:hypothetical protein